MAMLMITRAKKPFFRRGKWGLAFKDGKLYDFTDMQVLVVKAWPDPRAWIKRRSHDWQHTRQLADYMLTGTLDAENFTPRVKPPHPFALPNGQMFLPGIATREERRAWRLYLDYMARKTYLELIPAEVRRELERYSSRRWHLLSLFARCPGAMDLSRSNPALLYALASNWSFHTPAVAQPMRAARSLVWKKQQAIQEWLGFPGTEAVRRILAKIRPDALDVDALLCLRSAVRSPVCRKLLSHLPALNRSALMLASDPMLTGHVAPSLLEEAVEERPERAVEEDDQSDAYALVRDTIRMAHIVGWVGCPKVFHSLNRVQAIHDELIPRASAMPLDKKYDIPARFRDPPFQGTEHIIPIVTPEDMCNEGRIQQNCVASHLFPVMRGLEYIYRVEQPVRATLAVVYQSGAWTSGQLLKARNQPVDPEMRRQIFQTLFRTRQNAPGTASSTVAVA